MQLCLQREPNNTDLLAVFSLRGFQEIKGIKFDSCKRSWPFLSQSTHELTVGICVHNTFSYAFTCVLAHLCVCFPLRTNFEGEIVSDFKPNLSQRVWREMCLFCFCKIKFYCKMHMQKCCTEVTILPYWSCCQFFWCGKSWERELKFVEIVWGFTIRSLSNLPATVAGN